MNLDEVLIQKSLPEERADTCSDAEDGLRGSGLGDEIRVEIESVMKMSLHGGQEHDY